MWQKHQVGLHGGNSLEQVAQGACGFPIPGGIQGQAGCGAGQPGLVAGDPSHSRGGETQWSFRPFLIQAILWFCVFWTLPEALALWAPWLFLMECLPSHEPAEIWMLSDHTHCWEQQCHASAWFVHCFCVLAFLIWRALFAGGGHGSLFVYICFKYTPWFCVWLRPKEKNRDLPMCIHSGAWRRKCGYLWGSPVCEAPLDIVGVEHQVNRSDRDIKAISRTGTSM